MSLKESLDWILGGEGHTENFDDPVHNPPDTLTIRPPQMSIPFSKSSEEGTASVILKEDVLDDNKIKKYRPSEANKKSTYEPESLGGYIGQTEAKEEALTAIKIIEQLRPIHILINGWAGCGKSLLAKITTKLLKADFIYRVPEQLQNVDQLLEVINFIQENENLTVFMLDEIHTIDTKLVNVLLPILQDLKYGNVDIRPFVLIGATTDKDKLAKKQAPFLSRFQSEITLRKYNPDELKIIIKNYKENTFPNLNIKDKDYELISKNSRGIPREAIALLLRQLVVQDIDQVFKQCSIIKDGLRKVDLEILKTLSESEKPMGANFLSQSVGISQADYEEIYERFLVEQGYVTRTARGRTIRKKGKKLLNTVEEQFKKD